MSPDSVGAQDSAADFDKWIASRRAELEQLLAARVAADARGGDPGRLVEAMRYSLLSPGKRLRPLLALAAAEAVAPGATIDDPIRLGCAAVELVHCYSLIHDDLPAMDDDDMRRGRPSNHKVFGDATAILAGDALLTLAFEWIAEAGLRSGRPADFLRASAALARGAGVGGMVRGQARDLGDPPPATLDELERLHAEKTAALFGAALDIGAAAGGASESEARALGAYGRRFGIAFQHADDLDDADHPDHAARARGRLGDLITEAQAAIAPLGARGDRLRRFAQNLLAMAS
ncbi:MAG TPA: polyprenyl synthetase family protein [Polyangia bacterium]|jgi:geranylgeranyl pyrophosphate synthase|nr:polyprenyl synthetase family protein [Polyangia bacterium]